MEPTSFYPQDIHSNTNVPEVKITNISLFDKPYKTDSAYWQVHTITLPYTDNSVSFPICAPSVYRLPEKWIFLYNGRAR